MANSRVRRSGTMPSVLCSVSSVLRNGRNSIMIPLGVFIEPSDWQTITAWSLQVLSAAESPTLVGLLTAPLPTSLDRLALFRLQAEVKLIPPDSVAGPVSDGWKQLTE